MKQYDVCIITTIHGDFDNRIYQRQLAALADAGMRVCIVAPWGFSRRERQDYDYVATRAPGSRFGRIAHGFRSYRAACSVDASLYIFHDPDFLPFGALLKGRRKRPVIYDCHENIPLDILYGKDWIPRPLRKITSVVFQSIEEAVVRYLGASIVVVPELVRRFSGLGVKTYLVRNFANFDVPSDHHNEKAIIYTGSLSRDYGAYTLLEIARELKKRDRDIPLRIVDRFYMDEELRNEFLAAIHDEGLKIEFLQPVNAEEMPKLLEKGFIGLSPLLNLRNKAVAYPTKIFEYYAFGLAVVATNTVATREIMQNGELGFLVGDRDYSAWADAIEALCDDENIRAEFVDKARKASQTTYNWDVEKLVLIDCVNAHARAAG